MVIKWLYNKLFGKFHKGDRVEWHTDPLCPYQGKEGTITEELHKRKDLTMVHIQLAAYSLCHRPTGFLKRIS